MVLSRCWGIAGVHPGSHECSTAPGGRRPLDQAVLYCIVLYWQKDDRQTDGRNTIA